MSIPSSGDTPRGPRVTEFLAPLALVILISLGIWWYVAQVGRRVEQQPAPPTDLRETLPPLPGRPSSR